MSGEGLPDLPPAVTNKGFAIKERVAGGGFATVYRGTWNQKPGEDIAAKIISLANVNQIWVMKNLKNEMKIIKKLNHPNVIRVYEMVKTSTNAYIFMEFAKNGSVMDMIDKSGKGGLSEAKAKKYMKDILNGIAYIHKEGVAHRDIKPDNFLIDQNDRVLLSDFGFACISLSKTDARLMKGTGCGTSEYMAVEIKTKKEGEVYDAKATDLYSLGVSLFLMVYKDLPFDPRNEVECIRRQLNKEYKHKSQANPVSEALKNLIDRLLDPNPKTRITAQGALQHKWFSS